MKKYLVIENKKGDYLPSAKYIQNLVNELAPEDEKVSVKDVVPKVSLLGGGSKVRVI
jgi:hypothetical protein